MAGLKETMFSDGPVAFWSFDEDLAGFEGNQILDELNNANPLVIHSANTDHYLLEQLSLNDLEVTDQHSIRIAQNGKYDTNWSDYATFFECIHTTAFDFPNRGSFSIEFLYYKDKPDNIRDNGNPGWYNNVVSPLIKKGTMVNIYVSDNWSGSDYLYFDMFNASRRLTVRHDDSPAADQPEYKVFEKVNHVVCTYNVEQIDVNEYRSTMSLYLNGRLWGTNTETHVDSWPNTAVIDSWLLCGNGGGNPASDFNTELLIFDQVAVYPYALDSSQVSNHYRKTKHYDQMIKDDYPKHYWRLDEFQDIFNLTLYPDVGGVDGRYYGQVDRHEPGPEKLIEARSVRFDLDACAVIDSYGTYGTPNVILDINQATYTFEFWFKAGDSNRGVLAACVQENHPWNGLVVWLNSKDNAHSPGNIQVNESLSQYVNSVDLDPITGDRNNWNDNNWHLINIVRTGNRLKLYIDGQLDSEGQFSPVDNDTPSQLHLMGMAPGELNINGHLSEVVWYDYALQEMQIQHRWLFTTRYRISGYTLLQGNPISATVRFYNHLTGDLMGEVESDSITGEYTYEPPTNRYVDVLSFIPDNKTTRYRVHGPVKPAEYDDSHLIT
jgi:hypothetical protein